MNDIEPIINQGEQPKPLPTEFRNRRAAMRVEHITVAHIEKFLDNLRKCGLWYESAEACGLAYSTILRLRKQDDEFKEWCDEAMQSYRESLERECHRRAVEGWDEPVFSQRLGTQIGVIRKHDPRLLELMLKRHIPEYREKFEGEIKVTGGVLVAPISPTSAADFEKMFGGEKINLLVEQNSPMLLPDQSAGGDAGSQPPGGQ
jgi:hypothetical protein